MRELDFNYASRYDTEIRGFKSDVIHKKELDFFSKCKVKEPILDYGGGTGRIITYLMKEFSKVDGYEPNIYMRKIAQNKTKQKIHSKIPNKSYNTIICIEVLQEVQKKIQNQILNTITKLLTEHGKLILVFMNSYNMLSQIIRIKDNIHPISYFEMKKLLQQLGYRILKEEPIQILPFPNKLASLDVSKPKSMAKWICLECEKLSVL